MILNKNKVEKAAKRLHPVSSGNRHAFKSGVSYAESQLSELAIDFADWIDKSGYIKTEEIWCYWDGVKEYNTKYTTEKLFKEFLKERY